MNQSFWTPSGVSWSKKAGMDRQYWPEVDSARAWSRKVGSHAVQRKQKLGRQTTSSQMSDCLQIAEVG